VRIVVRPSDELLELAAVDGDGHVVIPLPPLRGA
jgi:hypothetical protein